MVSEKQYKFDAIINNAAFGFDKGQEIPSVEIAKNTMGANVIGTINLTNSLLPYLSENGKVINVSSKMAALSFQKE